ncbi:uncharacterized protein LOC134251468 [Saccostrea cucullata]|uniref:uncharacterized protein LOC134251468 n=1 Tax=Saccostrea cuccullata TaxID=36930 RepID=UPI002ED4A9BB
MTPICNIFHGNIEFYCNTCKRDLCAPCKEKHVIDLDTMYHDIVISQYKNGVMISEACKRHKDRKYDRWCLSCENTICVKCNEHLQHETQNIESYCMVCREKSNDRIIHLRGDILPNNMVILSDIKSDQETEIILIQKEISKVWLQMTGKCQTLKEFIDKEMQKEFTELMSQLFSSKFQHIENMIRYEDQFEQSANRPVLFLLWLKKFQIPKMNEIKEDVICFIGKIKQKRLGRRKVRNDSLLEMIRPEFHKSLVVTDITEYRHISLGLPNKIWVSDKNSLILTNANGDILHQLAVKNNGVGVHTVTREKELLYINQNDNICKLSQDTTTESTLVKRSDPWKPHCIYSSLLNGVLLIGSGKYDIGKDYHTEAKVTRYNSKGLLIQTIQYKGDVEEDTASPTSDPLQEDNKFYHVGFVQTYYQTSWCAVATQAPYKFLTKTATFCYDCSDFQTSGCHGAWPMIT